MLTDVLKSLKIAYKPRQITKPSLKITHKLKNTVTFVYESKVVIRDYEQIWHPKLCRMSLNIFGKFVTILGMFFWKVLLNKI